MQYLAILIGFLCWLENPYKPYTIALSWCSASSCSCYIQFNSIVRHERLWMGVREGGRVSTSVWKKWTAPRPFGLYIRRCTGWCTLAKVYNLTKGHKRACLPFILLPSPFLLFIYSLKTLFFDFSSANAFNAKKHTRAYIAHVHHLYSTI